MIKSLFITLQNFKDNIKKNLRIVLKKTFRQELLFEIEISRNNKYLGRIKKYNSLPKKDICVIS